MYESFYSLAERPFDLAPDAAFLFLGQHHRHALTMLEYALLHGVGFALLTGEIGSGKTTLIRRLMSSADSKVDARLLSNIHRTSGPMLPWVAHALGLAAEHSSAPRMYDAVIDYLAQAYVGGRRVVLIADEAQNLDAANLEELRVLSNVNADKHTLLQIMLIGQPELRTTLQRADMRQFAQRIAIDYHLGNLRIDETHAYVSHRLSVAGGSPELIESAAIDLVHTSTGGVPRLINILCDTALVYGFADQKRHIDAGLMSQVIRERAAGGLLPLVASGRRGAAQSKSRAAALARG
jgi:general secretion pathway protein A